MTAVISQPRTSVTAPLAWYVPPSRPSAAPPTPTVMYRRRRLMVLVVATVVVLAAAVALGRQVGSGEAPASPPGAVPSASAPLAATTGAAVYVVQPGDTVWGVARRLYPTLDQTAAVARLVGANGRSPLRIGQHLVVPPAP